MGVFLFRWWLDYKGRATARCGVLALSFVEWSPQRESTEDDGAVALPAELPHHGDERQRAIRCSGLQKVVDAHRGEKEEQARCGLSAVTTEIRQRVRVSGMSSRAERASRLGACVSWPSSTDGHTNGQASRSTPSP